jgi:trehalose-phosphatase
MIERTARAASPRLERGGPPSAEARAGAILKRAGGRRLAVFLDYDGTLTPIVGDPRQALMPEAMRRAVRRLAKRCIVGIISGRDLEDVRAKVAIDGILYAGSHGFDIAGPVNGGLELQLGREHMPALDRAERRLRAALAGIPGAEVERKRFSIAVHYRNVGRGGAAPVKRAVEAVAREAPGLRKSRGKKVLELGPRMNWHKGRALLWILAELERGGPAVFPVYVGDDTTDENAFRALKGRGIGILVAETPRISAARFRLKDPLAVEALLRRLGSGRP